MGIKVLQTTRLGVYARDARLAQATNLVDARWTSLAERTGLENRFGAFGPTRVRIPPSPLTEVGRSLQQLGQRAAFQRAQSAKGGPTRANSGPSLWLVVPPAVPPAPLRELAHPLVRFGHDDPVLTVEGSGCYERSTTVTNGVRKPCNRRKLSVRTLCPEDGRCGSRGRKMDGSQTTSSVSSRDVPFKKRISGIAGLDPGQDCSQRRVVAPSRQPVHGERSPTTEP
jgi:hypothetical protein